MNSLRLEELRENNRIPVTYAGYSIQVPNSRGEEEPRYVFVEDKVKSMDITTFQVYDEAGRRIFDKCELMNIYRVFPTCTHGTIQVTNDLPSFARQTVGEMDGEYYTCWYWWCNQRIDWNNPENGRLVMYLDKDRVIKDAPSTMHVEASELELQYVKSRDQSHPGELLWNPFKKNLAYIDDRAVDVVRSLWDVHIETAQCCGHWGEFDSIMVEMSHASYKELFRLMMRYPDHPVSRAIQFTTSYNARRARNAGLTMDCHTIGPGRTGDGNLFIRLIMSSDFAAEFTTMMKSLVSLVGPADLFYHSVPVDDPANVNPPQFT